MPKKRKREGKKLPSVCIGLECSKYIFDSEGSEYCEDDVKTVEECKRAMREL